MAGTLYLVGTPIGNLNDLSPRAIETLKSVDFIAAEDTRVTLKLLNHFGIRRPLISYYEHNKVESAAVILPGCSEGRAALLSPTRVCPRSPTPARSWCGCAGSTASRYRRPRGRARSSQRSPCPAFRRSGSRLKAFSPHRTSQGRSISKRCGTSTGRSFFTKRRTSSWKRSAIFTMLGDRDIALGRELTKLHEEIVRTTIGAALEKYRAERPRGNLFSSSAARRSKKGRASRLRMRSRSWRNTAPGA